MNRTAQKKKRKPSKSKNESNRLYANVEYFKFMPHFKFISYFTQVFFIEIEAKSFKLYFCFFEQKKNILLHPITSIF